MKVHEYTPHRDGPHGHGAHRKPDPPRAPLPEGAIRKQPASSVPFGEDIARHGGSVWVAYLDGQVVGVAATAGEARRMYRAARAKGGGGAEGGTGKS